MSVTLLDLAGEPLAVGDKVIYTTNTRESGLTLAVVLDIVIDQRNRTYPNHKIKLRRVNFDGTDVLRKKWISGEGHVITDKPVAASTVDYSPHKFYKVG